MNHNLICYMSLSYNEIVNQIDEHLHKGTYTLIIDSRTVYAYGTFLVR